MVGLFTLGACAGKQEDITPAIVVSPNAKSRIAVMDRLRHHGNVRRWLPHVTVEEVDDDDAGIASDADSDETTATPDDATSWDNGGPAPGPSR